MITIELSFQGIRSWLAWIFLIVLILLVISVAALADLVGTGGRSVSGKNEVSSEPDSYIVLDGQVIRVVSKGKDNESAIVFGAAMKLLHEELENRSLTTADIISLSHSERFGGSRDRNACIVTVLVLIRHQKE